MIDAIRPVCGICHLSQAFPLLILARLLFFSIALWLNDNFALGFSGIWHYLNCSRTSPWTNAIPPVQPGSSQWQWFQRSAKERTLVWYGNAMRLKSRAQKKGSGYTDTATHPAAQPLFTALQAMCHITQLIQMQIQRSANTI